MADHELQRGNASEEHSTKEELLSNELEDEKKSTRTSDIYRTKNLPERFDRPGLPTATAERRLINRLI